MMRGRCGSREQLMSYIEQNYKRRYRATYTLTDYNLFLALEAYHYGVENNVGVDTATSAVCEIYRCSYKRLSNFLRELRLWDPDKDDWVLPVCQKTINSKYSGKKREEAWDLVLDIPHPFLYKVRPIHVADEVVLFLLEEVGILLNTFELSVSMEVERVSEEVTEETRLLRDATRDDLVVIGWELSWNRYYEYTSKEYGVIEVERWIVWRRG